ncbi:MAG: 2-oxoacid:acceptor oxidoreductase family protein, partial [Pseudomonadota bacterium]
DPVAQMRAAGVTVYDFDAGAIARELGDLKLVNTVMLGAISDYLPFPAAELEEQVVARFRERKPTLVEVNKRAFAAGREAARDRAQGSRPLAANS